MSTHTAACWAMPECAVCGRRKHPRGRDPGIYAASGYCGHDCPGFDAEPHSGHFWPGEEPELRAALDACDDCGATGQALYEKDDHHGGIKRVCADRDACHIRSPG